MIRFASLLATAGMFVLTGLAPVHDSKTNDGSGSAGHSRRELLAR